MAKASTQTDDEFFKTLFVGDSGTGKTGALLSLIQAGYNVRMLDYDGGAVSLTNLIRQHCPERINQFDYIMLRDKFQAHPSKGLGLKGPARAYTQGLKYLNTWDDDSIPAEWGDNTIFVLDTLTSFGRAAFLWAQSLNPTAKDPRQWYGAAQDSIKTFLDLVTSKEFKCHVFINSHLQIAHESSPKLQITAIGKALGGEVPKVFNNMLIATLTGTGDNIKRQIETMPTALVDAKTASPWLFDKKLPLETGLATIFKAVKDAKTC